LTTKNLGTLISKLTREAIGVDVAFVSHCGPRSIAANMHIPAGALLNQRDQRVTEEHYNLSTDFSAGEEYALITKSYRENLRSGAALARHPGKVQGLVSKAEVTRH
jgi:hypothetical protein